MAEQMVNSSALLTPIGLELPAESLTPGFFLRWRSRYPMFLPLESLIHPSSAIYVVALTLVLGLLLFLHLKRRQELRSFERTHRERLDAKDRGSHKARLHYPDIDLSKCVGCGACVRACPEEGVLDLLHGQAVVVHGARCVGHGRCAEACPTAAIALTFADLSERRDLPALDSGLEAVGMPGLFIAGELSGFALVGTAITQGVAAADAIAMSLSDEHEDEYQTKASSAPVDHDLLIVGSGPAGISCSLRAKELGLNFGVIEQADQIGGTVAGYPRRKMVMTQPVHMPLHGKLPKLQYQKEELVELWEDLVEEHQLPVQTGVRLTGLTRADDGTFAVETSAGLMHAKRVCLALGRRGTPRKLGIPGEDRTKVAYSLIDAESYKGRRIVVVGGGDSAIEAAVALSEQDGNEVTLTYRKKGFFRLKAKNDARINEAIKSGKVRVLLKSELTEIHDDSVSVRQETDTGHEEFEIPNDEVFIFAGGVMPFPLLEQAGVSFDPEDRPAVETTAKGGRALMIAGVMFLFSALGMGVWAFMNRAYYSQPAELRPALEAHEWLRPSGALGLTFGVLAITMFAWNLTYLVRRSERFGRFLPGSLTLWMHTHVFTGLFSLLCVLIHAGFTFRNVVGGHALIALFIVITTGLMGRYLYAFVPHAANGKELDLEGLRQRLTSLTGEWDRCSPGFGQTVHQRIDKLVDEGRWRGTLLTRIQRIITSQIKLRSTLHKIKADARAEDIGREEVRDVLALARVAHRLTMQITHYEEIRAVLSTWRYIHRWLALLMVVFSVIHIVTAVRYGRLVWPDFAGIGRLQW
jgi:dihydropyrimidine dehydrogenase (NAD+) subunit PreT